MDNSTPGMDEKLVLYMDDLLSDTEKTVLEKQLSAATDLQEALTSLQQTREVVRLYGLQQKVATIHSSMMDELESPASSIGTKGKNLRYVLAIAASVILVIGGFLAYSFFTLTPDKVFNAHYQSYSMVTIRDDSSGVTAAEKAYRAGNYKEVLRIHDDKEDRSVKAEFLTGAAALELNNNSKAVKCFNEVIDMNKVSSTPVLNDEAEYYLSLSYIQNQDYDSALELLTKIKEKPGHLYHEKVTRKLLRQLKMLKWK